MPEIKITPLGAGQDVGRSCILLHIGGKNIMLDCGMHMGFKDERKFPDFTAITAGFGKTLTDYLDCVIISHFHLDHCGALPYMTEIVKYEGPIYMTHPTKAICPMLLEDMVRIHEIQKKERNERTNTPKENLTKPKQEDDLTPDFFTSAQIQASMKRVTAVNLHQTTMVDKDLEIKAYYAGHVLGAAMFRIRVGQQSVVYTGDYNMTPDRHLGAAWIDRCRPDLLITESTYATTIRDSKRCRERDFLKKIHECVDRGGKVLIPVFALGRAQELCILLETYWERMNLKVPIYFASGMTERANHYYKMFITWTNQKIKRTFVKRNMFDFHHIKPFDKSYLSNPGAMVVFATPGMLHAGLSLHIFKKWAPNENNMVIMPGFCVSGTVGSKVIAGNKRVEIDGMMIDVKMSVQYMSFSAHADAKGIMQLIHYCQPKNVLLVHGEATKMEFLKQKINQEFDIRCFMPANGETCTIATEPDIPVDVALSLMKQEEAEYDALPPDPKRQRLIHGVLIMKEDKLKIVDIDTAAKELNIPRHSLQFTEGIIFREFGVISRTTDKIAEHLKLKLKDNDANVEVLSENEVVIDQGRVRIQIRPVPKSDTEKEVSTTWNLQDDDLGSYIFALLTSLSK